jgi:hypothetical protein
MSPRFPELPILSPQEMKRHQQEKRSQKEKFGGLFYLGIGGLVVLISLLAWFGWSVWSMSPVWSAVYVLSDGKRPEAERLTAADRLIHNADVTPRQLWDLSLNRTLPPRARYLLAAALDERALEPDPTAYALAVARSEGWPDWLRLALVRPLAYGADRYALPQAPLAELRQHPSVAIQAWAAYAQAVGRKDAQAREFLSNLAQSDRTRSALAQVLVNAANAPERSAERRTDLDRATELCLELPEVLALGQWATRPAP